MIDPATLADLWDQYADRLLLVARPMGDGAEDAVQEAFVALARQSQLPRDPMAWLVRVTRNRMLQWKRGNRRRRARESVAGASSWFDFDMLGVERYLDGREVTAALIALPSPEREIIVMHLWGEMTFESIAEVIGVSRASAHRTFQRGLRTLQARFDRESKPDSIRPVL